MKTRRVYSAAAALLCCAGMACGQFTETFDAVAGGPFPLPIAPTGWKAKNNSVPRGLIDYFQGNTAVFTQFEGAGYLGVNFNSVGGNNTISNWMVTPIVTLTNGAQFTFYTRTVDVVNYPDRLQVRMNKANPGTNVGTAPTDTGDFTDLLLDINPTYSTTDFPSVWTQYTVNVTGVTGSVSGRLAFRYFVEGGGPAGFNSDYIGIDLAQYSVAGTTGACCFGAPYYTCGIVTQTACVTSGGTYAGNGTTCAAAGCAPAPSGACCLPAGCSVLTQEACTDQGGTYAGNNVTCANANCPTPWAEQGDAGDLTSTAQIIGGSGSLPGITGNLNGDDADMYQINVCNAAGFNATTVGGTTVDTQLFMFKTDGTGLVMNDDAGPLQSTLTSALVGPAGNGLYYLAVSQYDKDPLGVTTAGEIWLDTPFASERAPDGAAAAEAVGSWSAGGTGGAYSITLQGSCYVGGTFGACCFGAPNYTCSILSQSSCTQQGGTYAGNGIACAQANCPQAPTGACCRDTGCSIVSQSACTNAGGTYAGNNVTCAAANCPPATFWQEVGDAGNLPGTAQAAAGSGNLLGIRGSLGTGDSDMFKIKVCDAANFSATTVGLTTVDTQLFVFKLDGTGVAVNDDTPAGGVLQSLISNTFVSPLGNGDLYLAVSQYDTDPLGATSAGEIWLDQPFATERAPDGPAAAEAVGSWSASVVTGGTYAVALTGSCFTSGSCYANCDGSTATPRLTANDFQCFINEYAANHSYANCDGSTGNPSLTANDFQCFINAYAAGCS